MGKQRNKFLGEAEIPRNVQEFMGKEGVVLFVQLLLQYLEELEEQNRLLHEQVKVLQKANSDYVEKLTERLEAVETTIERIKGVRIFKPFTDEEIAKRKAEKEELVRSRPWKTGKRGNSKGWTHDGR